MTDRDELAALLLRAIQSSPEEPFTMPRSSPSSLREVCVDGWVDFVHVAEALIADGWARVPRTFKCLPGKATFTDKDGNTHELTIKPDIHTMVRGQPMKDPLAALRAEVEELHDLAAKDRRNPDRDIEQRKVAHGRYIAYITVIDLVDKHTRESTPTIDYTHTTDPRGWAGQ